MGRLVSKLPNNDPNRLRRVLDDKRRSIGVDVDALNNQVADKEQTLQDSQRLENSYAKEQDTTNLRVRQLRAEAERQRREASLDCASFWTTQQGKGTTREWDLNRKDALRLSRPARLNDDDPNCGPSSFQKFSGEDLKFDERKKTQQESNRTNWSLQLREHQERERKNAIEASQCDAMIQKQNAIRDSVAIEKRRLRSALNKSELEENLRLAIEKERTLKNQNAETEEQDIQELSNMQKSLFLNEVLPENARKECWKGMKDAEIKQIFAQVHTQCTEKQQEAKQLQEAKNQLTLMESKTNQRAFCIAKEAENQRRSLSKQNAEFLKQQMRQKQDRDVERNEVYRNYITNDYFTQFQTSHR